MKKNYLYEVFIRANNGIAHQHCGSLHAIDDGTALQYAKDVYMRRNEGVSIWVVKSEYIFTLKEEDKECMLASAKSKIYRQPSHFNIPENIKGL